MPGFLETVLKVEHCKVTLMALGMTQPQADMATKLAFEAATHTTHPNGEVTAELLGLFEQWLTVGISPKVVLERAAEMAKTAASTAGMTEEEMRRAEAMLARNGFSVAYSTAARAKWFRCWDTGGGVVVEFYTTGKLWAWSVTHEVLGSNFAQLMDAVQ